MSIDLPAPNVSVANGLDARGVQANFEVLSTKLTAGAGAPTLVSSLPVSPVDGQEIYYQSTTAGTGGGATNTMADVGAAWHLRYRSAASGSYKWEFVGGSTLSHQNGGGSTTCTASFVTYAPTSWTSPTVKVPLAGAYQYSLIVNMTQQGSGSATINYQNLNASTTGVVIGQAQVVHPFSFFGIYVGGLCGQNSNGNLIAGETLSYRQASLTAGNAVIVNHVRIELTPMRVGL